MVYLYRSSADAMGTPYAPADYSFPTFDVGVVVLDHQVKMSIMVYFPSLTNLMR